MATASDLSFHTSSCLEKILEHRLLADLATTLWLKGMRDFEVLHSEVDASGYDIVIEAGGVMRHIQLKTMADGGKRREVGINVKLATKPSGCVVWMTYDPATLELTTIYWFGNAPGEPLPLLGNKAARHSKGNALGVKLERPGQRLVARSRFTPLRGVDELAAALFGCTRPAAALEPVLRHP